MQCWKIASLLCDILKPMMKISSAIAAIIETRAATSLAVFSTMGGKVSDFRYSLDGLSSCGALVAGFISLLLVARGHYIIATRCVGCGTQDSGTPAHSLNRGGRVRMRRAKQGNNHQ